MSGAQQVLLAREVQIEGVGAHPGASGHRPDRELVLIPDLEQEVPGCLEQVLAEALTLAARVASRVKRA